MNKKEIKLIIKQLKEYELKITDVPEEIRHHKDVVLAERKYGLRKELNRGYDVIRNLFFVKEELYYKNLMGEIVSRKNKVSFESIEDYYDYLEGDIYNFACYKYCNFELFKNFIEDKNIDISKLLMKDALINNTIDDESLIVSREEEDEYILNEKNKKEIKEWIKRFDACSNGSDLEVAADKYSKTKLSQTIDVSYFFYEYIFKDIHDKDRFNAIMEYMCTGKYPEYKMTKSLCLIYDADEVVEKYDYYGASRNTNNKNKRELKEFVDMLNSGELNFKSQCNFDSKLHLFYEDISGYCNNRDWPIVRYQKYFNSFEEMANYKNGDFRGADFSKAIHLSVDFSLYETDEQTKIPISSAKEVVIKIKKWFSGGRFKVNKRWETTNGNCVKESVFVTPYFFDFVFYLKKDISDADLIFCDGLDNIPDLNGLNIKGVKMRSHFCEKYGISFDKYLLDANDLTAFSLPESNEEKNNYLICEQENDSNLLSLKHNHGMLATNEYDCNSQRISYITDLHLEFRLKNAKCRSKEDVLYVIKKIVDTISYEAAPVVLIGGDVSSNPIHYALFLKLLEDSLKGGYSRKNVIFVLGNHELWKYPQNSVEEIARKYKEMVNSRGMYLIHNDLLYVDSNDAICIIPNEDLCLMTVEEIRKKVLCTRLIVFGGIGFAKYNQVFNANQGIYRLTLDRKSEIKESEKYEILYKKIIPALKEKNTIILTHFPQKDWCADGNPSNGLVYINGHNHRNEFYDDGEYRIYSDNQIGYHNENVHLKSLLMDNEYDCFSDYDDGIYSINGEQYNDFYRGKNIRMNFTRKVNKLYMLKKAGFYCFIHESTSFSLSILNGGALKKLPRKDINYYYEHMDEVIAYIQEPFIKYSDYQKKIADEIKKIGGSGKIHGCIIDIDWFNHLYVNPVDSSVTAYWAASIIDKMVYPDVISLIKSECPSLYSNYKRLIKDKKYKENDYLLLENSKKNEIQVLPQEYLNTDIYKASREIKKMQKLNSNILSTWYEGSESKLFLT